MTQTVLMKMTVGLYSEVRLEQVQSKRRCRFSNLSTLLSF